jgi:hypothetical protein
MGGRVCLLYMLLAHASVVFLGSESCGTRDHILLSQIRDFLFVASYDSRGYGGGIRPRLHTGTVSICVCVSFPRSPNCLLYNQFARTEQKKLFPRIPLLLYAIT